MKIFLADDATLMREGLAGILARVGHDVVGQASDAPSLLTGVAHAITDGGLDIVVTDVRMPPGMSDDGLRAAVQIREEYPRLGVMVLSQYVAPAYATALFQGKRGGGLGYLLKERVAEISDFLASLTMVASGGVVVDPDVAAGLVRAGSSSLASLTPRELEVLELMARGLSNSEIQSELYLSPAAVSKHVAGVFTKLGLPAGEDNRRVRAVLTYLTETGRSSA